LQWSSIIKEAVDYYDNRIEAIKQAVMTNATSANPYMVVNPLPFPSCLVSRPTSAATIQTYQQLLTEARKCFEVFVDDTARAPKSLNPDLVIDCFAIEGSENRELAKKKDYKLLQKCWQAAGGEGTHAEWILIMKSIDSYSKFSLPFTSCFECSCLLCAVSSMPQSVVVRRCIGTTRKDSREGIQEMLLQGTVRPLSHLVVISLSVSR
jgi:hypothetical protein